LNDLVLLDFDGVIADSLEAIHKAAIRALREHGRDDLISDDLVPRLVESNWFEGLRRMGVPPHVARLMDDLVAESVAAGEVAPYDGMPEAVARLGERHCVVIVTSNRSDIVEDFLAQWEFVGIEAVLGGDKGKSKVPKLRGALRDHPHREAWFVGDSVGDIVEGRAAGVSTVAATWGWHSELQLLESSPDRVAHTPQELLRLLL
jgi:phosphoglycolate phosphatase